MISFVVAWADSSSTSWASSMFSRTSPSETPSSLAASLAEVVPFCKSAAVPSATVADICRLVSAESSVFLSSSTISLAVLICWSSTSESVFVLILCHSEEMLAILLAFNKSCAQMALFAVDSISPPSLETSSFPNTFSKALLMAWSPAILALAMSSANNPTWRSLSTCLAFVANHIQPATPILE